MKKQLGFGKLTALFFIFFIGMNLFYISRIQAAEPSKTIQIATVDYPPLMGSQGGIMTDIVTEAFKAIGITAEYKIYPMARIVWAVTEGPDLAVVGSRNWFHKAGSADHLHFVSIYFPNLHFFSLKEKFPQGVVYDKLEDLKEYKIGYIRGGSLIPLFKKANLEPDLVATLAQNVQKVYAGRVDMFAATELGGWAVIQKYYPDETDKFTISDRFILSIDGDIVFAKDQQNLMNTFKQGFDIIKQDGRYMEILKRYYGERKIPEKVLDLIK